jgi:hypothetical protein
MSFATKAAVLGALAAAVNAHGTVTGFLTDGTFNQGFLLDYYYAEQNGQTPPTHYGWYAENLDNGFVEPNSYGTADIICHKNAKVDGAKTATVAAGGTVDFQWTSWPESHIGPVITYVASCGDDCSTVNKEELKFVKIDEAGYDTTTKSWAAVDMISNNNTWTTTVPSTLKAGKYVFRHEIIALHGAGSENGAQNYPQCVNIEVTGSGTELPEGTLGTALYSSTDPGILFNPYTTITGYEIPGPALMAGGDSGAGGQPASSAAPVSSATAAASSASPAPTTLATAVSSGSGYPVVTTIATSVVIVDAPTGTAAAPSSTATAPSTGDDTSVPKTFTLETFIAWLQEVGASSGVARRHARMF